MSVYTPDIVALVKGVGAKSQPGFDSDFADRLSWGITSSLMLAFGVFIGAKQYFGTVIDCWTPPEFTGFMDQYTQQFCFVNSTYFVNDSGDLPDTSQREGMKIGYYQWAPWVLGLQALLFMLPHILWRLISWKSGVNVKHVVKQASELQKQSVSGRAGGVADLAAYIQGSLHMRFHYRRALDKNQISRGLLSNLFSWVPVRGGNFLVFLYIGVKLLNLLIAIGQLFILQGFLDRVNSFYGLTLLRQWLRGDTWGTVGLFPRVTYCDFAIRILGNQNQRYTVQCVLGINMINEKLFAFLWWWTLLVIAVSALSLLAWLDRVFFPFSRFNFISSYLESASGWMEREEKSLIAEVSPDRRATKLKQRVYQFVYSFLGQDGVFVLRLVAWNSGVGLTASLMDSLYQDFRLVKADAKQVDRAEDDEPKKRSESETKV